MEEIESWKEGSKIFIGVVTRSESFKRRNLIRLCYDAWRKEFASSITINFVVGNGKKEKIVDQLRLEEEKFKDLIILDIEEGMNNGKTFNFVKESWVNLMGKNYTHWLKTDDDSFINFPNFINFVNQLPRNLTYFGRYVSANNFMHGGGYGVSMDVLEWLATSGIPQKIGINGLEDLIFSRWIAKNETIGWYEYPPSLFHVPPYTEKKWAYITNWTQDAILVHRVKSDESFIETAQYHLNSFHPGSYLNNSNISIQKTGFYELRSNISSVNYTANIINSWYRIGGKNVPTKKIQN